MRTRKFGDSGLETSAIGFGGWPMGRGQYGPFEDDEAVAAAHAAFDGGVTLFDTAAIYGWGYGETLLGKALKGIRQGVVLVTKGGRRWQEGEADRSKATVSDSDPDYLRDSIDQSLKRLQTDYIDVYMIHRPDPRMPMEETLRALDDLVRQGKVLYTAGCNFEAWRFVDAYRTSTANGQESFTASQFGYSMLARSAEAEMIPACRQLGVAVIPYLPLAAGMLTGKVDTSGSAPPGTRLDIEKPTAERWITPRNIALVKMLDNWAEERGHSVLELAFAWLLAEPIVATVIAGASSPEQVQQNAAAAEWQLTLDERADVTAILDANPPENAGDYFSSAGYFQQPTEMAPLNK